MLERAGERERLVPFDADRPSVQEARRDPRRFEPLYRKYVGQVYSFALYELRDHHAAEDVTEQVFLQALRGLATFHERGDAGSSTFRSWLFTIARRRAVDHLRRQGRRPESAVAGERLAERPCSTDVAEQAESSLALQRALAVVDRLSPDQREVILLCVLGGLRPAQVAPVLGKTEGAVRVLQHRALRRLAQLLPRPVVEEV